MFFFKKKIRQLMELLERKKVPADLQEVKHAIESMSPVPARATFQKSLRTRLLLQHKTLMIQQEKALNIDAATIAKDQHNSKAKSEENSDRNAAKPWKFFWPPFKIREIRWPSFTFGRNSTRSWSFAVALLLIVVLGGALSYPLIPAPQVLGYSLKGSVRKISYNAPIKIAFSQPMDQHSVEKAFQIEPPTDGRFEWAHNSLLFHPTKPFQIGQHFTVTLGTAAKSLFQKALPSEYQEIFEITSSPQVLLFSPSDKSIDVPTDAQITIHFDRPMIALTSLDQGEDKAIPVKFDPPLKGKMKWLGTDSIRFIPEKLAYASHYTMTIPKGTWSAEGGTTDQDFRATFDTIKPKLLEVESSNEGKDRSFYGPKSKILLHFNQAMDVEKAKSAIHLLVYTGKQRDALLKAQADAKTVKVQPGGIPTQNIADIAAKLRKTFTPARAIPFKVDYYTLDQYKIDANIDQNPSSSQNSADNNDDGADESDGPTVVDPSALPQTEELHQTLVLTPSENLPFDSSFLLTVDKNLGGAEGTATLDYDTAMPFDTVGQVTVTSSPEVGSASTKNLKYGTSGIHFNFAHAMDAESVKQHIEITPKAYDADTKEEKKPQINSSGNTTFNFDYDFEPSTDYTITVKKGAKDLFGQELAQDFVLKFKTAPLDPGLEVMTGSDLDVLDANKPAIFYVRTTNIDSFHINFKPLSNAEFMAMYHNGYVNFRDTQINGPLSTFDQKVTSIFNKPVLTPFDFAKVAGGPLKPGYYYFDLTNPNFVDGDGKPIINRHIFMVSYSGLTVKVSGKKMLVWATSFADGSPIANMDITVKTQPTPDHMPPVPVMPNANGLATAENASAPDQSGSTVFQGTTNSDGLVSFDFPAQKSNESQPSYFVSGQKGDDFTMTHTTWSEGIEAWNFGNIDYGDESPYLVYLYTDRPIYRPGHTVYFKGILRKRNGGGYVLPGDRNVEIQINDAQGNNVYDQTLPLNANGTFNGQLTLGENALVGDYFIFMNQIGGATFPDVYSQKVSFHVANYRKPDYQIDLKADQQDYVNGDKAQIKVKASYFFGAALPKADLTWSVHSDDYYFFIPADSQSPYASQWFSFSDEGYLCYWGCKGQDTLVSEGKAKLDANGEYTITVPLDITKQKLSQFYTVEATVSDLNNQTVSDEIVLPVHQGQLYVGVRNDDMVSKAGQESKFSLVSVDFNGNPLPNKTIQVSFMKRSWNTVKKKNVDSDFYYENSYDDAVLEKKTVTTDAKGFAQVSFLPREGGMYKVLAEAKDGRGNKISAGTTMYASSSTFVNWGRENNDRIELVPDKLEYKPGDIAHVLIKSPYQNVHALVTYERQDLLESKVIKVTSNSQIIDVPITEKSLPNIFVSVFLVKGSGQQAGVAKPDSAQVLDEREIAAMKIGYATLQVNNASRKLELSVTPDRTNYHPGDEVTLQVKSTNHDGKAVKAEISISVVDKSVLSLTENVTADLLNAFYRKLKLDVFTASTLTKALSRVNVQVESGLKGGGGAAPRPRGNFKDTAFWQAVVTTDASGNGTVHFKLPDNLTTWQILAIGITPDTLVGSQRTEFVVNKDVIVRPVLPRFLIINDEIQAGAIVHNYLKQAKDFEVSLEAKGVKNLDGSDVNGQNVQRLHLEPGEEKKVDFALKVMDEPNASFTLKALASDDHNIGDAITTTMPIHTFSFPEVVATSSVVSDNTEHVETVWLPNNIDPKFGELNIAVAPTLAASITKGIQYLVNFPYGCVEQTASALLPDLAVKQMVNLPGLGPIARTMIDEKKLQKSVETGLETLYKFQKTDGGWGLWDTSPDQPYLTSYVLFTLSQAEKAGYRVDSGVLNRGVQYLKNAVLNQLVQAAPAISAAVPGNATINASPLQPETFDPATLNTRAYALYVLAEMGQGDLALSNNLFDHRKTLNLFAKADLAMNFQLLIDQEKLGGAAKDDALQKINTLKNEILVFAKETPRGVQFEEQDPLYGLFDTNDRTTALVLQMLNRVDRTNVLIPKILHYLLMERKDGHFSSTQETAISLFAMVEYLRTSGELEANYDGKVIVNQSPKIDAHFTQKNINTSQHITISLKDLLPNNQDNEIIATRDGQGKMYFDMNLTYYLPTEEIKARDEGIEVHQEYFAPDDMKEEHPLTSVKVGDNVKGKITVIVPEDRHYVMVEDFLPAGLEGVDFNLKTSQQGLQDMGDDGSNCQHWDCYNENWRFNYSEIRDDRMMYFADFLPKGVYEIDYFARATTPGTYHDLPTQASETYFPEVFGRSEGRIFKVEP